MSAGVMAWSIPHAFTISAKPASVEPLRAQDSLSAECWPRLSMSDAKKLLDLTINALDARADDHGGGIAARGKILAAPTRTPSWFAASEPVSWPGFDGSPPRIPNSPYALAAVVGNEERTIVGDCNSHWPAPDLSVRGDESGNEVLIVASCSPLLMKRDTNHFVPGANPPVPRSMFGREDIAILRKGEVELVTNAATSWLGGNGDVMGIRLLVAAILRLPAGCALRVSGVVSP